MSTKQKQIGIPLSEVGEKSESLMKLWKQIIWL